MIFRFKGLAILIGNRLITDRQVPFVPVRGPPECNDITSIDSALRLRLPVSPDPRKLPPDLQVMVIPTETHVVPLAI
jgi:hypothetical protein